MPELTKLYFILIYDVIHDFLVWLRTGSNPADINRLQSHIGKTFTYNIYSYRLAESTAEYFFQSSNFTFFETNLS